MYYLCVASRSIAVRLGGERKVRATQSIPLPNWKVPLAIKETASATENYSHLAISGDGENVR